MIEFFKHKKIEDTKTNVQIKNEKRNLSVLHKPESIQPTIDMKDYILEINKVKTLEN